MNTHDFYYDLPQELIAQTPIEPRDSSRLLVFDSQKNEFKHKVFRDIIDYLTPNDVLVINRSKVMPARLFCHRDGRDEVLEILLLKRYNITDYEVLVKPGKKFKINTKLIFSSNLSALVTDELESGERVLSFKVESGKLEEEFDKLGEMPLPPYIKEKLNQKDRYQTVYAKEEGSSAAPTAGLHFTPQLIEKIKKKGVQIEEVILHVGLGTFRPVKVDRLEEHKMHTEEYFIDQTTADSLNNAKKQGKRIVAVGTTSVRTLESAFKNGMINAGKSQTNIFIYPPYDFRFVDALITNFHLPESTLLMLVSALMGKKNMEEAYKIAIESKYRFFTFGDAMFIF